MDQNAVAVKIGFAGELHRLRVDLNAFTLDALTHLFVCTFGLVPGSFVIKYTDSEGDTLNVVSDAEFVEACRVFLSGNRDELKALKFIAVTKPGVDHPGSSVAVEPLLEAVEKLVATLNTTVEKVRQEEWKGVDVATEALSQAAVDAKETLVAARASAAQERPFEQVLEDTSDGLKSAATGISSFAQRLVKNFISEKKPEAVPNQVAVEPVVAAAVQPEEKIEETPAAVEAEEEIEVGVAVTMAAPEPEVVVPVPVQAAPVAFSEAEIKWAEQLSTVRAIFPDVETATAIDALERNSGDVNVVINVLMEELM